MHQSHPVDPNMIQARAAKISYWKAGSKTALNKAKIQIMEPMTGDKQDAINDVSDESSEEEAKSKQKTSLSSHPTTSLTPSLETTANTNQTSQHPHGTQFSPNSLTSKPHTPSIHCPFCASHLRPATETALSLTMTPYVQTIQSFSPRVIHFSLLQLCTQWTVLHVNFQNFILHLAHLYLNTSLTGHLYPHFSNRLQNPFIHTYSIFAIIMGSRALA